MMGIKTPRAVRQRPGRATASEEDAAVASPERILCRLCRTGELRLYMCGPRCRGRCQACGTVFVFLWSCARQGWFQWTHERGNHV